MMKRAWSEIDLEQFKFQLRLIKIDPVDEFANFLIKNLSEKIWSIRCPRRTIAFRTNSC